MKKIFLAALVAASAMTANAQVYIGGALGYSSEKIVKDADAINTLTIAPEIGYCLDENSAVGLSLGVKSISWGESATNLAIGAYYRRYFCGSDNLKLFVDGVVEYGQEKIAVTENGLAKAENTPGYIAFGVRPGIKYAISDKFDLVASTGILGYKSNNKDAGDGSAFKLGLDFTAINFGLYYNF